MHCPKQFLSKTTLRRHCQMKHFMLSNSLASVNIDTQKGIFMVATQKSGLIAPIHVQKHVTKPLTSSCSNQECSDIMQAAGLCNPSVECDHLEAIKTAQPTELVCLQEHLLDQLVKLQIFSQRTKSLCSELKLQSEVDNSPLAVYADFESLGFSSSRKYYSVYTNEETYYCKYKRVRVTYNCDTEEWSCQCPISNSNQSCVHEAVAKWYMFEHQHEDFLQTKNRLANILLKNT